MSEAPNIPVAKLVRIYIKMRDEHNEMVRQFQERENEIKTCMDKVKGALLEYCKANDMESVKTSEGSFYRTVRRRYTTADWESMNKFILEHQVPELLEKRLHQGNMGQFLNEHPDLLPPGLNCDAEYSVTVRRSK